MQALRFTAVAVIGVIIDFAIAFALTRIAAVPLWLAAVIAFFIAALGNYAAHELWTFRTATTQFSSRRAIQFVLASVCTLLIRLTVIALLGLWFESAYNLLVLVIAIGISFSSNFVISKFLVFRRKSLVGLIDN